MEKAARSVPPTLAEAFEALLASSAHIPLPVGAARPSSMPKTPAAGLIPQKTSISRPPAAAAAGAASQSTTPSTTPATTPPKKARRQPATPKPPRTPRAKPAESPTAPVEGPKKPRYRVPERIRLLDEKQEWELLQRIENSKTSDCAVARLRRKLLLRRFKSSQHFRLFNVDALVVSILKSPNGLTPLLPSAMQGKQDVSMKSRKAETALITTSASMDESQQQSTIIPDTNIDPTKGFHRILYGKPSESLVETSFQSPYTYRKLRPFIWRDFQSKSIRMRLLQEIRSLRGNAECIDSIDYCYFRPEHLHQVNELLCNHFWPGIEMTEALSYPDFSVIACYKRVVVGCAFMTPEAYITYVLVHPEWQGTGIGTFMLYHLIQTCKGKDITLHVSANNPAMILYQRFGFKAEEFIIDFYDKYLPDSSSACKNAFFLRLRR